MLPARFFGYHRADLSNATKCLQSVQLKQLVPPPRGFSHQHAPLLAATPKPASEVQEKSPCRFPLRLLCMKRFSMGSLAAFLRKKLERTLGGPRTARLWVVHLPPWCFVFERLPTLEHRTLVCCRYVRTEIG